MRTYATAQLIGGRPVQCDATAVHTAPHGARAYVVLDGIGITEYVRDWTREAARRLARSAAGRADAEAALRWLHATYAEEPDRASRWSETPQACALVAVTAPGRPLTVAWCGDVRAYLLDGKGVLHRLTQDHNLRRIYPPNDIFPTGGNRNVVTSCLGSVYGDQDVKNAYGHPAIETATVPAKGRLLCATDGAYEPVEDAGHRLADHLTGSPRDAARRVVKTAVALAEAVSPMPDNATVLVADLP